MYLFMVLKVEKTRFDPLLSQGSNRVFSSSKHMHRGEIKLVYACSSMSKQVRALEIFKSVTLTALTFVLSFNTR